MPFMFFLFTNFEFILCLFPFAVWVLSSGFICHNGDLGLTLISHARNIKGKQLRLSFHIIDYLILFLAINIKGLIVCLRYHQQNIKGIGQPQQKGAFDRTRRRNNLWIWGEDYANIDSEEQVSSVNSYQNVIFDFRWTGLTLDRPKWKHFFTMNSKKTYVIGK